MNGHLINHLLSKNQLKLLDDDNYDDDRDFETYDNLPAMMMKKNLIKQHRYQLMFMMMNQNIIIKNLFI